MYSQSEADLVRENRMLSEQLELAHRAQAGLSLDVRSLSEQLADAQATVEALQAQIARAKESCRCYSNWWDRKIPERPSYEALQQQVEALQRERDGLEQNCLNNHVTIEQADAKVMKLEGERGMWATERIDLLTQLENAEFALDAEREKVKELEANQVEYEKCTDEQIVALNQGCLDYEKELTQLQALVRALPSFHVVCSQQKWYLRISGYFCSISEDEAMAWNRFMQYRATLDATTPAADTSIIGKCEPPSQWNRNAQVRGDIS